ncbi:MAG: hypothetical protein KatS3mg110_0537 [Pirellulaceae bacterium]|nr:MAG: hypothetical protein KatS3mg110_0537 [Pirellulaceae bacterium]
MTTTNLANRVIQELQQNKAKAALLLIGLTVATYYWLPLAKKWIGKPPKPTGAPSAPAPAVTRREGTAEEPFDWETYVGWAKESPLMQPQAWPAEWRDPFAVAAQVTLAHDSEPQPGGNSMTTPTPEQAGLVLRGTLCTPTHRWANLNGEIYLEGETVTLPLPERPVSFRLVAVGPSHVELECNGRWYRLALDTEPAASDRRIWISATP